MYDIKTIYHGEDIMYTGSFKHIPINGGYGDLCLVDNTVYLYNGLKWEPIYLDDYNHCQSPKISICKQCGAPLQGNVCEYCGTRY